MRCVNCRVGLAYTAELSLCEACLEKIADKAVEAERIIHKEKMNVLRRELADAEQRAREAEAERRDLMKLLANLTEKLA